MYRAEIEWLLVYTYIYAVFITYSRRQFQHGRHGRGTS